MCKCFSVCESAYYAWVSKGALMENDKYKKLDINIKALFNEHKKRYGSPRLFRSLNALNLSCGKNLVAKRMKALGLKAVAKKKYRVTTDSNHNHPVYKNVLSRAFEAKHQNQKWVSDITYIHTNEGFLYLAVVLDLYSRAIIGWSMSKTINKDLVCNALTMALFRRRFPKGVIVHSDRGSQYCSYKYRGLIDKHKLIGSMSRKGNCWDNAPCESFFHTLKVELISEAKFKTREEAKAECFSYIEGYYNKKRIHSAIDYKTPSAMEYQAL
jgi:transposase InsO family protein